MTSRNQLELGQYLNPHGYTRGETLDEGLDPQTGFTRRLDRLPFGSGPRRTRRQVSDQSGQLELGGMDDPSFNVGQWLARAEWLERHWRAAEDFFETLRAHGAKLTPELIRSGRHLGAMRDLEQFLRRARHPGGYEIGRYLSRVRLGVLVTEATNRARQLEIGRIEPKVRGPALDPARLPDDRLEHLIQTHRALAVVDALRAERERRLATNAPAA